MDSLLERVLVALDYVIKEADGWHDDSRGGPIEDNPEMGDARRVVEDLRLFIENQRQL